MLAHADTQPKCLVLAGPFLTANVRTGANRIAGTIDPSAVARCASYFACYESHRSMAHCTALHSGPRRVCARL